MDSLMGYNDSDEEDEAPITADQHVDKSPALAQQEKPATPKLPSPDFCVKLPSPDFDGAAESNTMLPTSSRASVLPGSGSGTKRPLVQAQGIGPRPGPVKSARGSPAQHDKDKPGLGTSAAMLPPQLRGRSNVATEDVERLFTKRSLAAAAAKTNKPEG